MPVVVHEKNVLALGQIPVSGSKTVGCTDRFRIYSVGGTQGKSLHEQSRVSPRSSRCNAMARKQVEKPEVKQPAQSKPVELVKVSQPVAGSGLAAKLTALGSKSPKKAKTPTLELDAKTVGINVSKIRGLKTALDAAKAEYEAACEELTATVAPKYRDYVRRVQYVSSAHVSDGTEDLLISWKDAYSKIPLEVRDELVKIIGPEKFGLFIETGAEIKIKTADESVISKVVEVLEKSGLVEHFEIEGFLKPSTKFTQERFKLFSDEQNGQLDPLVKQYKASVRVR